MTLEILFAVYNVNIATDRYAYVYSMQNVRKTTDKLKIIVP